MPAKKKSTQKTRRKFPIWILPAAAAGLLVIAGFGFSGMMRLEETNTFCGSCHTQPESTYLQRTNAAPVDEASNHMESHKTRCIDCHSGRGLSGRAAAMMLGARNAAMYVTRTMTQPARQSVTIEDGNCLKCHADISADQTRNGNDNHFHFLLPRWAMARPGRSARCVECHTSHTTDNDTQIVFLNRARTEAVCQRCHNTLEGGG